MYGIFTYIYLKNQPNVGKYTILGSYGVESLQWTWTGEFKKWFLRPDSDYGGLANTSDIWISLTEVFGQSLRGWIKFMFWKYHFDSTHSENLSSKHKFGRLDFPESQHIPAKVFRFPVFLEVWIHFILLACAKFHTSFRCSLIIGSWSSPMTLWNRSWDISSRNSHEFTLTLFFLAFVTTYINV